MARNRWYDVREEAFLQRRVEQLDLGQQPYGSRQTLYQQLAAEMAQRFGVVRPWQGVQQRVRRLLRQGSEHIVI